MGWGHVIHFPKQNTWKSEPPEGLCIYLWSPISAFHTQFSYSCKCLNFCYCSLILSPSLCFSCQYGNGQMSMLICLKKLLEKLLSKLKYHGFLIFFPLAQGPAQLPAAKSRPISSYHSQTLVFHGQRKTAAGHLGPWPFRD